MTELTLPDNAVLHYEIEDFTDPWDAADTVVFLHGLAESGELWRTWSPYVSRRHRVIRPDHRGFGRSTAMPSDFPWRFETLQQDLTYLLDALGLKAVHLVGAKIGGTHALSYAARNPERVKSVTVIGAPLSMVGSVDSLRSAVAEIRTSGVEAWVRASTAKRLGSSLPPEAVDWWIALMSLTPATTLEGFMQMVGGIDIWSELDAIRSPALIITSKGGFATPDMLEPWRSRSSIRHVHWFDTDSYHLAASHSDECAAIVSRFLHEIA